MPYNYELTYRPGKDAANPADFISRRPDKSTPFPDNVAKTLRQLPVQQRHPESHDPAGSQNVCEFEIHGFSDASKTAVCAALYTVEYQGSTPVNQSLLVAKSRVAPKDTIIPRLELIAAMTLAKLHSNVLRSLKVQPIRSVHNWVDSVTVLHWLANKGTWSAFVRYRVAFCSNWPQPKQSGHNGISAKRTWKSMVQGTGLAAKP